MSQIFEESELIGKTIKSIDKKEVNTTWGSHEECTIVFSDNSFVVIESVSSQNCSTLEISPVPMTLEEN